MGLSMALCSVHTQVGCRWKMTAPAMQMPVVAEGRRSRLVAVSNRTNYVPTVHSSISRAVSGLFFPSFSCVVAPADGSLANQSAGRPSCLLWLRV